VELDKHVLEYIPLYLDDELEEGDRLVLEAHVTACAACRAALEADRRLVSAIKGARPNYSAPESLRENISRLLQEPPPRHTFLTSWPVAACVALFLAAVVVWVATGFLRGAPVSFVSIAADSHQRYLKGQLPLEVFSNSPEEISGWFTGKLRFNLKLPEYPQQPGKPKPYQIEGARLVGFRDDYAAYIVYRLNNHPISLLVTTDSVAKPSGGEEIPWQGLRFHFQSVNGWKVLTWSDNGLTYALVSDLEERGQASCIVCHQDERVFRGLQSSRKQL
jgi:anti-sigma factor RsiW